MGDENPIRTLGDYSKPNHEGYRNTIDLPVGNNMVPLRFDTIQVGAKSMPHTTTSFKESNQTASKISLNLRLTILDGENRERMRLRLEESGKSRTGEDLSSLNQNYVLHGSTEASSDRSGSRERFADAVFGAVVAVDELSGAVDICWFESAATSPIALNKKVKGWQLTLMDVEDEMPIEDEKGNGDKKVKGWQLTLMDAEDEMPIEDEKGKGIGKAFCEDCSFERYLERENSALFNERSIDP
ncbi:hypothetical protein Tco_0077434 [Tanacetum coccineum]